MKSNMLRSQWLAVITLLTSAIVLAHSGAGIDHALGLTDTTRPPHSPSFEDPDSMLFRLLDSAYTSASVNLRRQFFETWRRESTELQMASSVKPGTLDDIYAIFEDFYKPDTTTRKQLVEEMLHSRMRELDTAASDDEVLAFAKSRPLPRDAEYIVVQAQIRYRCQASSDTVDICPNDDYGQPGAVNWATRDSVELHPQVDYYGKPILYLTPKYKQLLAGYLALRSSDTRPVTQIQAADMVRHRIDFLLPEMTISPSHEGVLWHYVTFPEVWEINFNANKTRAVVKYQDSWNTGGSVCYAKLEGKWILQSKVRTWEQ